MNHWLEFLKEYNAQLDQHQVTDFGDANSETHAATSENIICDMTHMGLISVQGEEATDFLQNQLSNDVKQVNEELSQLNAYCTPKGRVLSMFFLFRHGNRYILQLPIERVEATLKRLQLFLLRTKATLSDVSEELITIGIAGNTINDALRNFITQLPTSDYQSVQNDSTTVIKTPGSIPRYLIVAPVEKAKNLWRELAASARPCANAVWRWLDIRAGIPQVYEANVEAFVPQMMNLHSINGISFQKGCYPGQEVVARMHYLGKLKRRMYLANIKSDNKPQCGDLLFAENDTSEQGVGRIVDAQPSPDGGFDALAVLQIASAEGAGIHLGKPDGPLLSFKDLPYTVELEREK